MPENAEKHQKEHRIEGSTSSAKGRERNILGAYHDIAATLFTLEKTADLEEQFLAAARDGDYDKVHHFLQRRANEYINIDGKDKTTGNTALIWAVKRGHLRIVQLLLKYGGDVTLRNFEGKTAVELASPAIRQVLLESVERMGCTHRHLLQAAWQGNFEVVRKLLETKTLDINCRNNDGFSPMHLVVRDCHLFEKLSAQLKKNYNPCSVVKELLEYRADVHAVDDDGKSPIHYASLSKCNLASHLVAILLNDGSSHNARDRRCYTPIHCASQSGNIDVVKTLIEGGSDVNSRAYAGYTPLHVTAIHGHEKVAVSLLNHGADVTLVDDSGLTPVDVAKNKKVKTTLREAWVDATQQKVEKVVLKPVRPPTRESSRMSFDESMAQESPSPKFLRKGEVIFEGIDNDQLQSKKNGSPSAKQKPSLGQRQLTNAEKADRAEERMLHESGRFTPASPAKDVKPRGLATFPQSTSQANPPKTPERNLAPIRPKPKSKAKRQASLPENSLRESTDESTTPVPLPGINPRKSCPEISSQEYAIPITVFNFDQGDCDHFLEKRRQSDGYASGDIESSPDVFKGRSSSKTYIEDIEDAFSPPPRLTPLTAMMASGAERTRLNIPDTITESEHSYESKVFTFEPNVRMATASRRQTVPVTTFITQTSSDESKQNGTIKMACSDVNELVRGKSVLRDEFNIEESRVQKSTKISPDTSTSLSSLSSPSSHSEGVTSETGEERKGSLSGPRKDGAAKTVVSSAVQRKDSDRITGAKLHQVTKDNSAVSQEDKTSRDLGKKSDKITVHSDLLGKVCRDGMTEVENVNSAGAATGKKSGKTESTSSTEVTVINVGEFKRSEKNQGDITSKSINQGKGEATNTNRNESGAKPKEKQGPNSVALQKTDKKAAELSQSKQGNVASASKTTQKSGTESAKVGTNTTSGEKKLSPRSNTTASNQKSTNSPRPVPIRKTSKGAIVVISRANTNSNLNETMQTPSKQGQQQKVQLSASVKNQAIFPSASDKPVNKPVEKNVNSEKNNERKTVVVIKKASSKDDLSGKGSKTSPRSKNEGSPRTTDSKLSNKADGKTAEMANKPSTAVKSVSGEAATKPDVSVGQAKKTPPPRPSQPPSVSPHYKVVETKPQDDRKQTNTPGVNNGNSGPGTSQGMKQGTPPQADKGAGNASPVKVPQPSKSVATPTQSRVPSAVPQPAKSQAEPSMSRAKSIVQPTNKTQTDPASRVSKIKSVASKSLIVSKSGEGQILLAPRAKDMLREVSKAVASKLEKAIGKNDNNVKVKESVKSVSKSSIGETSSNDSKSPGGNQAMRSPTKVSVVGSEDLKSPSKSSLATNGTTNSSQSNGNKSVSIVVTNDTEKVPLGGGKGNDNDPEAVVKVTISRTQSEEKPPEQTPFIQDVYEHFENPYTNKEATKLPVKREPSKVSRGNTKVGSNRLPSATNKPAKSARSSRSDAKSAMKKQKANDLSVRGVATPGNGQKVSNQPRSGKGKRKTRKKKKKDDRPELGERDLTRTAFISGIGWHVATDCNENPDVEAVGLVDSDSDSDEDKSEAVAVVVNDNSNLLKVDVDDDIDEPSSFEELVQDNVHFDSGDTDSSKFSSLGSDKIDNPALSRTVQAIKEFDLNVKGEELDRMLGDEAKPSDPADALINSTGNEQQGNLTVVGTTDDPANEGGVIDVETKQEIEKNESKQSSAAKDVPEILAGAGKTDNLPTESDRAPPQTDQVSLEGTKRASEPRKDQNFQRSFSVREKGTGKQETDRKPLKRSNTLAGQDRKRLQGEVIESKDINSIIDEILTITSDHTTLNDSVTNSLRRRNSLTKVTEARRVSDAGSVTKNGVDPEEVTRKLNDIESSDDKIREDAEEKYSENDDYITLPEMLKIFHAENQDEMEAKINAMTQEQESQEPNADIAVPNVVFEAPSTKTPKGSRKSSKQEGNLVVIKKSLEEKPPLPDRPKSSVGKSPRSIKPTKQKAIYREVKTKEMYHSKESLASTFQTSEFGSDQFSLPCSEGGTLTGEDAGELVDSRTIRSQLGRRSAASQAGSTCTNDSFNSDVVICWKKGNMLGRGAYGTVWCGLTDSGGLIAVKQIEMNSVDMEKAEHEYEKIQEEVEMLKALRHKNIVGFFGTSLEDHIVQIFMEYVPGGSIANLLARFGALEEAVFRIYTKQVLEGVEYIHSNGVIHRDIKGGNIMLTQDGIIKLIDFGCAKRLCLNSSLSQGQLLKSMRGTPYWMAPEVVSETGHGKKSDIWSIGCTVFEMATRKPPWADMNPMAAIFAIGSDTAVPQLDNSFTPQAREFVNLCLRRNVKDRPSASELLLHPFIAKNARRIKRRNTSSAHGPSSNPK